MGEITRYKLEDCFHLRARIGWQGLRFEEFTDEGPYLVTGTDFVNGKVYWDTCYHVTEERYRQDTGIQLRENDLLITKDGTIGKTAVVFDCPDKVTLNSGVFVVRATTSNVLPQYLYYVLNSQQFSWFMRNILTGSTIKHLNQEHFYNFTFDAPDTVKQRKIVDVLVAVDDVIDKTRSMIEKGNWQALRKALEKFIKNDLFNARNAENTYGYEAVKEMPFFSLLRKEVFGDRKFEDLTEAEFNALKSLTDDCLSRLKTDTAKRDFWEHDMQIRQTRAEIRSKLLDMEATAPSIDGRINDIVQKIIELGREHYK